MNWLDHLETGGFDDPVRFRLKGNTEDAFLPGYDVEQLLTERHDLELGGTMDVAATVDDLQHREFAFDGAVVDSETVVDDVRELIEDFNERPENFEEWDIESWDDLLVELTVET